MNLINPVSETNHVLPKAKRRFHISVERDEAGFYVGRCRELPNAFTQAKTVNELKRRMSEVIELIMEGIEEEHEKHPDKIIEVVV